MCPKEQPSKSHSEPYPSQHSLDPWQQQPQEGATAVLQLDHDLVGSNEHTVDVVSKIVCCAPCVLCRTFAKDWPVPDAVKFHAQQLLSGQWDPYPIDMAFQPPCMVRLVTLQLLLSCSL